MGYTTVLNGNHYESCTIDSHRLWAYRLRAGERHKKARKVYKFNYVRLGRWTVRQPNGRFMRNLAHVWDIAKLGSKL